MGDDARWLDGNGIAALLQEALGREVTATERTCTGCGARRALGTYRAYRGAGWALRCPACDSLALRIAVVGQVAVSRDVAPLTPG